MSILKEPTGVTSRLEWYWLLSNMVQILLMAETEQIIRGGRGYLPLYSPGYDGSSDEQEKMLKKMQVFIWADNFLLSSFPEMWKAEIYFQTKSYTSNQ